MITREQLIMIMDIHGWEQDGKGLTFVNVGGNGERKTFKNLTEVKDFITQIFLARK
jgi:hypothetical protein